MKHTRKNITKIITTLIIGWCAIGWYSVAADQVTGQTALDNIALTMIGSLQQEPAQSTADMINIFCDAVTNLPIQYKDDATWFIYDSHQSLFIDVLCFGNTVQEQREETMISKQELLTKDTRAELTDISICNENDPNCRVSCPYDSSTKTFIGSLDECRLFDKIPNIYHSITNDVVNLMIAWAYGYQIDQQEDIENNIKIFTDSYLFYSEQENKDQQTKTNKFELCASSECLYPDTHKHLQSFFKKAANITKKTTVIDPEKLIRVDDQNDYVCYDTNSEEAIGYDIINCGLIGATGEGIARPTTLQRQSNMLYNENLRYKMFLSYYIYNLQHNTDLSPFSITENSINTLYAQSDAIVAINTDLQKTKQAMTWSIQKVSQIQQTFPLHIALVAYREKLVTVRDTLAKLYTPIHQLYYKLRNVQEQA